MLANIIARTADSSVISAGLFALGITPNWTDAVDFSKDWVSDLKAADTPAAVLTDAYTRFGINPGAASRAWLSQDESVTYCVLVQSDVLVIYIQTAEIMLVTSCDLADPTDRPARIWIKLDRSGPPHVIDQLPLAA